MNSLMNYGSDGENSNDSDSAKEIIIGKSGINSRRASDAIYDPVPMDMSEESNNNRSSDDSDHNRSPVRSRISNSHRTDPSKQISSTSDQRRNDHEEHSSNCHNDVKTQKINDSKIDKHERNSKSLSERKNEDKRHGHDHKESKRHREDEKKVRDDEKKSKDNDRRKDKLKEDKDDKSEREHHRDEKRDRDKRDDRERRRDRGRERGRDRSRDRDRRHSKDEKHRDRRRDDRRSRERDRGRSRSKSRSRSKERVVSHRLGFREERHKKLEKLGIEIKAKDIDLLSNQNQSYYNPLATATQGKYAEQIQKRKLLWANKKQDDSKTTTTTASSASTWVGTTFTHDQDGKVSAKFKRLMGIKEDLPATPIAGAKPDILKKQEEMFSHMEQQYEVARATTHTQRGVGLGYASGSFPFPR